MRARGMTLLEVMMAVTIVAVIGAAIISTFASTSTSMRRGIAESTTLANARFAIESVSADLMNVHYRDETSYNINMRLLLEEFERQRSEAQENGTWGDFERRFGPRDERNPQDDDYIGNPFEKGVLIDLSFNGTENTLTFARRRPAAQSAREFTYGLSRVTWELAGGTLVRKEDTVADPPRDWQGEVIEQEQKKVRTDIIAEGVTEFELRYAFWYDGQWFEADSWDSNSRSTRNPRAYKSEEAQEFYNRVEGGLTQDDPRFEDVLDTLETEPLDRTPSYVRIKLSVADPKRPKTVRHFTRIVRIPGALETYTLDPDMPDDVADAERRERDDEYEPIYPGVLEPE